MRDEDKDLVHLFVRDLDEIAVPARDQWRPAPRKESQLMKNSRYVLYASAVVAVLVLALIAGFGLRGGNLVAASPSPSATTNTSTTSSPTATTTSSGTPAPSQSTSSASGRYASPGLGYSIETPSPWHRSTCSTAIVAQQGANPVGEIFVPVSARDETGSDIGTAYSTLRVFVEANPQGLSPRQWAEQGKTVGGQAGERVEEIVYADRAAARKSIPLTAPGAALYRYFVANGGRMYVVDPDVRPSLDAATQQTMVRMVESFRFLTEAEQAAARAAVPSPLPSRTLEQVADGLAAALAAKNVDALAGFLSPCPFTAGENAGGITVSREKYLDDLRAGFAAGLVVTVRARPFDGDPASGSVTIASTWQDSRGTKDRKLVLSRGENDRWQWVGTIERF